MNSFELEFFYKQGKDIVGVPDEKHLLKLKCWLIDYFFGVMLEWRLGLPYLFKGEWDEPTKKLSIPPTAPENNSLPSTRKVVSIILKCLIHHPTEECIFLAQLTAYNQCLNSLPSTDYCFPYYDLQDRVPLS